MSDAPSALVGNAKLALQFSIANPDITTTIAGSGNPDNIRKWAKWAAEPPSAVMTAGNAMQTTAAPSNAQPRKWSDLINFNVVPSPRPGYEQWQ